MVCKKFFFGGAFAVECSQTNTIKHEKGKDPIVHPLRKRETKTSPHEIGPKRQEIEAKPIQAKPTNGQPHAKKKKKKKNKKKKTTTTKPPT